MNSFTLKALLGIVTLYGYLFANASTTQKVQCWLLDTSYKKTKSSFIVERTIRTDAYEKIPSGSDLIPRITNVKNVDIALEEITAPGSGYENYALGFEEGDDFPDPSKIFVGFYNINDNRFRLAIYSRLNHGMKIPRKPFWRTGWDHYHYLLNKGVDDGKVGYLTLYSPEGISYRTLIQCGSLASNF